MGLEEAEAAEAAEEAGGRLAQERRLARAVLAGQQEAVGGHRPAGLSHLCQGWPWRLTMHR